MAFTPSRVNWQFQQPNLDPNLVRPDNRIASGLDNLFNQYMQMKQGGRQDQAAALQAQLVQQQLAAGQRTAQDAEVTRAAQFGPRLGAEDQAQAITQAGPSFAGPVNPKYAEFVAGFHELGKKQSQSSRLVESEITKNNRTAGLYENGGGFPGQNGPEIVTKDGQQFIVNRDAKGNPRYSANPGSQIQSEIGTKVGLSQDGLSNLDYIEQVLKSPEGQALALKAGGDYDRLKSFQDPAAEKLANAILQAGDAEARVKTGASYNENELRDYFKKLVNPIGTMEGNLDRIARKKAFFSGQLNIYGQGRSIPSRQPASGGNGGLSKSEQDELAELEKRFGGGQ